MLLLDDNGTRKARFSDHPYALDYASYLDTTGFGRGSDAPQPTKGWGTRLGLENGNDFSGLNRLGGRAWLDTTARLGVTTSWDHFQERLPGGGTDELVLGDLMLTWRFAQAEWMQMHAGLGGRGLFDRYRVRGGFNFLYSADVFPIEPLVLSSSVEVGHLNEAFTLRLRASAGVQWKHAEAFVGYDWLRIGGADLHGPMAGLRLWF
ncbi:MAG: hypothetical protein K2W96_28055 [Gemmataceae bacterium]|nr:hypothetical protein [Gemmataceae bacterium]